MTMKSVSASAACAKLVARALRPSRRVAGATRLKDRAESCYRTGERSLAKCDAPFNSLKCCVESALLAEPPKLRKSPFFLIRICSDKYLIRHVIE